MSLLMGAAIMLISRAMPKYRLTRTKQFCTAITVNRSITRSHLPTLEETARFMISRASLNLSLIDGCANTWSENMDFQPKYHFVISS